MACTGCARRRAKLKRLMDLANERFEELKQRFAGTALPLRSEPGNGEQADRVPDADR